MPLDVPRRGQTRIAANHESMDEQKLFRRLAAGRFSNVRFEDFVRLVEAFGFRLDHIRGSHRIYVHHVVRDLLNLQPKNGQAKPYQVREFMRLVAKHHLHQETDP